MFKSFYKEILPIQKKRNTLTDVPLNIVASPASQTVLRKTRAYLKRQRFYVSLTDHHTEVRGPLQAQCRRQDE